MASRLELHEELCNILGNENVYFNPPESYKMNYPCIRYSLSGIDLAKANNNNYLVAKKYQVIAIDRDPDTNIADKIIQFFPYCSFDRSYVANNLYHYVFTIYY